MLRVNTAAIIQSAIALVVAITIADTLRETIKWLGGGDSTGHSLGIRAAFTVLLLLAAVVVLSQCGDHMLSICADHGLPAPHTAETYQNTPRGMMDCGRCMLETCPACMIRPGCESHRSGYNPWCNACTTAGMR